MVTNLAARLLVAMVIEVVAMLAAKVVMQFAKVTEVIDMLVSRVVSIVMVATMLLQ